MRSKWKSIFFIGNVLEALDKVNSIINTEIFDAPYFSTKNDSSVFNKNGLQAWPAWERKLATEI